MIRSLLNVIVASELDVYREWVQQSVSQKGNLKLCLGKSFLPFSNDHQIPPTPKSYEFKPSLSKNKEFQFQKLRSQHFISSRLNGALQNISKYIWEIYINC